MLCMEKRSKLPCRYSLTTFVGIEGASGTSLPQQQPGQPGSTPPPASARQSEERNTDASSIEEYHYIPYAANILPKIGVRLCVENRVLGILDKNGKEQRFLYMTATAEQKREFLRQFRRATKIGKVDFKIQDHNLNEWIQRDLKKYEEEQKKINAWKLKRDQDACGFSDAAEKQSRRALRQHVKRNYFQMLHGS